MTDGSSNPVGISETVTSSKRKNLSVKSGFAQATGMISGTTFDPAKCVNLRSTADRTLLDATASDSTCRGCLYLQGFAADRTFNTVLPPNSPNCTSTNNTNNSTDGCYSPSSNHSGGVNAGYMDGSVVFISDNINCGNLATTYTNHNAVSGKSHFGVWGAIGTPSSGESERP
jgi:prepilin-type processing-associated H-X9-DG protein